jgi:hypothetical protein
MNANSFPENVTPAQWLDASAPIVPLAKFNQFDYFSFS